MYEAGQYHGLQIPFSLVLFQVVGELHRSKTLDFQNLKNMRLHGEIPVHSLKQQILAEEGPLLLTTEIIITLKWKRAHVKTEIWIRY